MGLFDKKYCDVCGEKIGLFGNRKLEDANLCKKCEAKLSYWFNERRHSSLEEIKEQLAYRDENRESVRNFHTTRTFGRDMKVLVDEDARKFMVTRARDLEEANPDVLDFSQVTGCLFDVDEHRSELKTKDAEGKSVSYDPPRYEYSYDFYVTIQVNHPYFDDMKFRLNPSSVRTGESRVNSAGIAARPKSENSAKGGLGNVLGAIADAASRYVPNPEYQEYMRMGQEIRETLMEARETVREEAAAQQAPRIAVTCPYCLATTTPDERGRCEYCGGAING